MAAIDWKKRYLSNTLSSYASFLAKTLTGFLIFRGFFSHLDEVEFGFWSLIWSFISYAVILDFGMGYTIQKIVAVKMAERKPEEIDRLVTTAFWTFVVIAAGFFLLAAAARGWVFLWFKIPSAYEIEFTRAYYYFCAGLALLLPLGIFPAALAGIQRIDVFNWMSAAANILYYVAVMWALGQDWAYDRLMFLAVALTCLPYVIAAFMAFPMLKVISLRPSLFDLGEVRSQLSFSLVAYCISFSNILLKQIDRVVIARMLNLDVLTLYQPGLKVAEMLSGFSAQMMNVVSPAAAHIHALGEQDKVRDLLFRSSRLLFILTTPCYLLAAFYLEPLLCLLTGVDRIPDTPMWAGHLLLLAIYLGHLTATGPDRVLMMCGQEKIIFRFTLARLASNLVLAIAFAYWLGPIGVALATVVSILLVNLGLLVPRVIQFSHVGLFEFIAVHVRHTAPGFFSFAAVLGLLLWKFPCPISGGLIGLWELSWRATLVLLPSLFLLRQQIQATWKG